MEKQVDVNLLLSQLSRSIVRRDRIAIASIYNLLEKIDWDKQPDILFEEYDRLISRANDILLAKIK